MEGRWTIARLPDCDIVQGPRTGGAVPVVPCDDAAVERAVKAIAARYGASRSTDDPAEAGLIDRIRDDFKRGLRAAGSTP